MSYCPENLKFNLSYTLYSTHKTETNDPAGPIFSQFTTAAPITPFPYGCLSAAGGVSSYRSFQLHYAGQTQLLDEKGRTFPHVWTGEYRGASPLTHLIGKHYLFINDNNKLALYIEDHTDPLPAGSFPPYIGNFANETPIPDFVFGPCDEDSDGNLLSECHAASTSSIEFNRSLLIDSNLDVVGADVICRQYVNPRLTQISSNCCCPTTFTVAVGREYVAAVTPQRLEVEFNANNHYPMGVIVSYASESQAEHFCSDSANYADPVDVSAEHFYSTISPGCSVSNLTRTINSTPTVVGPLISIVDGSTFWTISSYTITYSCEASNAQPYEPYVPPVPCVRASGSFVINRKINTCSISQQASESLFTDQVPANAYGTTYSTLASSVASNNRAEIEVDILINKNLFDISPLKTELVKLQAKLNHYNEVLGCKRDSVSSINNFHIMALGNDPNGLNNVKFSKANSPPGALQLGNTPSSSIMAGSEHSVYNYMGNLPQTIGNLGNLGKAAGQAMHLFIADPHNDSKVNYFVIPTRKGSFTSFNPKVTEPDRREQDNFIDQITKYINIVTKKMDKIEKYLEDNHSFCSEIQSVQNSNVQPGYVFQKLNYNVEIEYDVITYSTDCVDKTTASTASKTFNLPNQNFYPDKIIAINLD